MEKIESVQYSAALAITGTWRGTSRQKLYAELGWESLSSRRWSRRLTLFYKIINNLAPDYTMVPIPQLHQTHYYLRKRDVVGRIMARTEKFKSSFILTAYVNGTILNQNSDLHRLSLFLRRRFCQSSAPLQTLSLEFMTL